MFVFMGIEDTSDPAMTVKLDESHEQALAVPGAEPTGYGLGRSGWVTVPFRDTTPPLYVLKDWIEERYRWSPRSSWSPTRLASQSAMTWRSGIPMPRVMGQRDNRNTTRAPSRSRRRANPVTPRVTTERQNCPAGKLSWYMTVLTPKSRSSITPSLSGNLIRRP